MKSWPTLAGAISLLGVVLLSGCGNDDWGNASNGVTYIPSSSTSIRPSTVTKTTTAPVTTTTTSAPPTHYQLPDGSVVEVKPDGSTSVVKPPTVTTTVKTVTISVTPTTTTAQAPSSTTTTSKSSTPAQPVNGGFLDQGTTATCDGASVSKGNGKVVISDTGQFITFVDTNQTFVDVIVIPIKGGKSYQTGLSSSRLHDWGGSVRFELPYWAEKLILCSSTPTAN